MARTPKLALLTGAAAGLALLACQDSPAAPTIAPDAAITHPTHVDAQRAALAGSAAGSMQLATLRKATARYHRVEAALADGFLAPPPEQCVEAPPGGMGYHYVKPGHMDLEIDAARPEALLYEPTANGKLRLVGAEFLVHGDAWDAANPSASPTFAGHEFDPPADRSATAPPGPFYTLHVWIWKDNPDGMFAPLNPRVSCT